MELVCPLLGSLVPLRRHGIHPRSIRLRRKDVQLLGRWPHRLLPVCLSRESRYHQTDLELHRMGRATHIPLSLVLLLDRLR